MSVDNPKMVFDVWDMVTNKIKKVFYELGWCRICGDSCDDEFYAHSSCIEKNRREINKHINKLYKMSQRMNIN